MLKWTWYIVENWELRKHDCIFLFKYEEDEEEEQAADWVECEGIIRDRQWEKEEEVLASLLQTEGGQSTLGRAVFLTNSMGPNVYFIIRLHSHIKK